MSRRPYAPALLLCLLALAAPANAATPPEDPAHDALRQMKAIYEKAIHSGDLAPLRTLFTPETTAVMILGQEVKNFAELEQHWKFVRDLIGPGGTYTTTLQPETSLIYGDVAISRGTSDERVKTGEGRDYNFTSRWTAVSRKIDGEWKVVRMHGSMDPVTNVFVNTFMQRAKTAYGIGGVVVGILLGFIGARLLKRRSATA